MNRAETLKRLAREEGFATVAICRAAASEQFGFLRRWIEIERHGSMGYLARSDTLEHRADVRRLMPGARSILVVTHDYDQEDPPGIPDDRSRGIVARYARGRDYHRLMRKALARVHRRFEALEARPVPGRAYVDTGPILERELASRCGLGWFGRNTMLIHPRRGSYFFLGVLLLGVDVAVDEEVVRDHCGSCQACVEACPTGALLGRDETGAPVMDATRCISYLTIENRGPIPVELRPLVGNRVFGCDICQEVCPFNERFSTPAREEAYRARTPTDGRPGTNAPPLVDLMAMDEEAWESFAKGSPLRRAGRAGFLRNVAVALGNWGSERGVPVLGEALGDPEPIVRAHAAWALGRIGSDSARKALGKASRSERDPSVRAEIASAQEEAASRSPRAGAG